MKGTPPQCHPQTGSNSFQLRALWDTCHSCIGFIHEFIGIHSPSELKSAARETSQAGICTLVSTFIRWKPLMNDFPLASLSSPQVGMIVGNTCQVPSAVLNTHTVCSVLARVPSKMLYPFWYYWHWIHNQGTSCLTFPHQPSASMGLPVYRMPFISVHNMLSSTGNSVSAGNISHLSL